MSGCRFVGTTEPRLISARHLTSCISEDCPGCQPCGESHCERCSRVHASVICVECTDRTRADLHRIMDLCLSLPGEAEEKGVNSSAVMLDGPVAIPEDWRRRALLAMLGRVCHCPDRGMVCPTVRGRVCPDAAYLEDCRDEPHALTVLGDWDEQWRSLLAHETDVPLSLGRAFSYLDMQLTYMADQGWSDFAQFSREVRGCRVYLERVLSDDDRPETTDVPCLECTRPLVKVFGRRVVDDCWVCPRKSCARESNAEEYARAKHFHLGDTRANKFVKVSEALGMIDRPEQSLRTWMANGSVQTMRDERMGAILVWWPDVRSMHLTTPTRRRDKAS